MDKKIKLFVLSAEPSYYQVPIFRMLNQDEKIDTLVFFCARKKEKAKDEEFGVVAEMGLDVLSGYQHKFLKNFSSKPSGGFFGQINFGIIKEIVVEKPDFIWINGWNSLTSFLAMFTGLLWGVKIFIRGESPLNQELLKNSFKSRLKRSVFRLLFKKVHGFLYIGEENKKFYKYLGAPEGKLFFTPYAIDNDRLFGQARELEDKKSELKKELRISPEKTAILFVGKFIEKKRPMDLLRAYAEIKNENKSLILVGEGALRGVLENFVKEKGLKDVYFAGFKNQNEIGKFYAAADIFVLPSGAGETWGLVTNEAMCFGLPVVISDIVGCGPDLVREGQNGYIFPGGNVDALTEKIELLIGDSDKRKNFGKKSAEIISHYNYGEDVAGITRAMESRAK